ncbi:MAG: ABC transporter ATP-binding protein [Bacteroidales bacterium]
MLRVEELTIGYDHRARGREIVQQSLCFDMAAGEFVCLLGPNGCGKSTLLRTMAGIQPNLGGRVLLDGVAVGSLPIKERSRLLALVLTDPIETLGMRVRELVALGRNPFTGFLGRLTQEDEQRVEQSLAQVNLSHKSESTLFELSDGERQRALIAKALAQDAPIIFLDEPTAHLDLPNRVEIMMLLHRLAHEMHKCVLISTHELELAMQVADRIVLMKPQAGGVVDGLPETLVVEGHLQGVFMNSSVRFDPYTGTFLMNHKVRGSVSVVSRGEGFLTFWSERALARLGFVVDSEATLRVCVDERHSYWTIDTPRGSFKAGSMAEMLDVLVIELKE